MANSNSASSANRHASFGTAYQHSAKKALLLGSGELGKEVAIELSRYGIEVHACDRYANAPAMHIAQFSHVINMLDRDALAELIEQVQPDLIIPEIEAIATELLLELEQQGMHVVPSAKAANLTMNREGIRTLAAKDLDLPTSSYAFAQTLEEYQAAIGEIGLPFLVKPIMSSSGKGQSLVKDISAIKEAWEYAQSGGRAGQGKVIVEGFVDFDYEITLLTVNACDGLHFCAPIGHVQADGDYQQSWQPQAMSPKALENAQAIAAKVVTALGGHGLFGVELFVKGDEVIFSEVSPRPHDTGLVTLISQNLSEFALHARAILGLPIGTIRQYGASASAVILGQGESQNLRFSGMSDALNAPDTELRLFAKPEIQGSRRLGVALALDDDIDAAVDKAKTLANKIEIHY